MPMENRESFYGFGYVRSLLENEKERQVKSYNRYSSKRTPPGWDPEWTYEQRKPYAEEALSRIQAIDKTLEKIENC